MRAGATNHGSSPMPVLDFSAIQAAPLSRDPYDFFLGKDFLRPEKVADLRRDFPDIKKPGFLTVDEVALKGAFKDLIDELEGPALTEELSKKFGRDLHPFPRLTTIRKISQSKDGRIHTDGPSKVMTLLVYMNDNWAGDDGGRLRVLYDGENFEPYKVEVPPTMGTVFAFLRADNSWHGHKPFAGERRVVQVAWITDAKEIERKRKRNGVAQFFKGIFGR
jgi:SM-20-related protein